jgi:NADPH-dependent ferric siderophore reductase
VKLLIPPPGAPYEAPFDVEDVKARLPREQWPRTRTFSVRAWDPDARRLTIDFVDHGDAGVAGRWAAAARPGDRLQLFGPGGAYAPSPEAPWHLMIGDASVIPAIAASLERIPPGVLVHVLLAVDDAREQQRLTTPGELRLQRAWCASSGASCSETAVSRASRCRCPATGSARAPKRAGATTRRSGTARSSRTSPVNGYFTYTDTCDGERPVNGSRFQPPQRCSSRSPAIRAIRSNSDGQA